VEVESGVENLDELIQCGELGAHARLISDKISGHAPHETHKGPEGDRVVLHDCVDGGKEVGHPLNVAEVLWLPVAGVLAGLRRKTVVLEVGEEHVFELLEVDIRAVAAGNEEGGGGIRMRDVFASEEGDVAVCAVDVFFYCAYSEVSKSLVVVR
jgi:hypothetical protein